MLCNSWPYGAQVTSWHGCSNSKPSAHGGGLMRTHSWRSPRTSAWKNACCPLAAFKKRNLTASMAPAERWRCENDNRQSNIGSASKVEQRYR